jgi:hypothetical protein
MRKKRTVLGGLSIAVVFVLALAMIRLLWPSDQTPLRVGMGLAEAREQLSKEYKQGGCYVIGPDNPLPRHLEEKKVTLSEEWFTKPAEDGTRKQITIYLCDTYPNVNIAGWKVETLPRKPPTWVDKIKDLMGW